MVLDNVQIDRPLPTRCAFADEQDFKVSEFNGKIIRKLILHKSLNNKVRCFLYSIIDTLIRFKLSLSNGISSCEAILENRRFKKHSCKNPDKHQKYLDYLNYGAFLAQKEMAEIAKDKMIAAICRNDVLKLKAKIDAEKDLDAQQKLKKELKKYKNNEAQENLQKGFKEKKEAIIDEMKLRTAWNKDADLLEKLNEMDNPDPKEIAELLNNPLGDFEVLKKILQQDPKIAFEEIKKALQNSQEEIQKKLKDKLTAQIERLKEDVNGHHLDPYTAAAQLVKIVASYYPFPNLQEEIKKSAAAHFNDLIKELNNIVHPKVLQIHIEAEKVPVAIALIPNQEEIEPKEQEEIEPEEQVIENKEINEPKQESPKPELKKKEAVKKVETQEPKTDKNSPLTKKAALGSPKVIPKTSKNVEKVPNKAKKLEAKKEIKKPQEPKEKKSVEQKEKQEDKPAKDSPKEQAPVQQTEIPAVAVEEKPPVQPINNAQMKKLKNLLPNLPEKKLNFLVASLNLTVDKDDELAFIDKLKKMMLKDKTYVNTQNESVNLDFNTLIWYLIRSEKMFNENLLKFELDRLKKYHGEMTDYHDYLLSKFDLFTEAKDMKKMKEKINFLILQIMALQEQIEIKQPKEEEK